VKTCIVVLVALLVNPALGAAEPTVSVAGGQMRGATLAKGGAAFKGIPYAEPPVGNLRWREPMPKKPWRGVREATRFGAICPQVRVRGLVADAAEIDEDCLSLNVWTPEWPSKSRKPVMVWIPGGGNINGGSNVTAYDGDHLVRRGVVVVSLNYRVGSLGFFSHPELTRESRHRTSGNQGFLDQIAALKWVRDNIAAFGGDPNNVTVFGCSAGCLNAGLLLTSPLAKNLFHRVIGQSGPITLVLNAPALREAENEGEKLAARWKLPPGASLKDLRAVPVADVVSAQSNGASSNFGVVIDGYVFRKDPAAVFASGQQHRMPLLLGNTSRETIPSSNSPEDLEKAIGEASGPLSERAQRLYAGAADSIYGTPVDQWRTDTSFRCGSIVQLVWHASAGNTAFQYEFARTPLGRESLGATHCSDVSYVFGTLARGIWGVGPPARATSVDEQLADVIQQYWTNFAKTGDPNGSNLPKWPRFDLSTRAYVQFTDAGAVAKAGLRREFCQVFMEHVQRGMTK
jgi:para-nitrobenzyl esterase